VLRIPVVGAFVMDVRKVAHHAEPMSEPWGDPELSMVGVAERHAGPLAEGGRAFAEIDHDVPDFAADDADQYAP
jgi:hypothetical protein